MKLKLSDGTLLAIKKYPMPKKGNAPADFHLMFGDAKVSALKTGGGKFPVYTYFLVDGAGYYVKHDLAAGTLVEVVKEEPKATTAPAVAAPEAPTPEAPVEPKKLTRAERRAAAKAAKAAA